MTSYSKKIFAPSFFLQTPPYGTPGILDFKKSKKMKHPINHWLDKTDIEN